MAKDAEIGYNTSALALSMANKIFGDGAKVIGASYSGPAGSSAIYSKGWLAPGVTPSDSGVILSTGNLRDFTQNGGDPTRWISASNTAGFKAVAGINPYDAVWMDVDFIPDADMLTMSFVFSPGEHPENTNSQYNDAVGVWVNGTHVPVSAGNGAVSVNNINGKSQENLTGSNSHDQNNTGTDDFTIALSLSMKVNAGATNSIRIGVADSAEAIYDSKLRIAANSVKTKLIAIHDHVKMTPAGTRTIHVLDNDISPNGSTLTITHINGKPVTAGSTIALPSGQKVTLNADGSFTVVAAGHAKNKTFTYTVKDNMGHSDVGTVTINSVPCFVAGTMIGTPDGETPVEDLRPGDLVLTHDEGAQPLRWSGRRRVAAVGAHAPILIRAGTFGPHRALCLSPQHRILIRDSLAELLFGVEEVLVAVKELVNGRSVVVREGGETDYVHLLFDRHQVIFSEGLATESYLPGPQTLEGFDAAVMAEICSIFPEIDPENGAGYSPSARRTLRSYEAQVLVAAAATAA